MSLTYKKFRDAAALRNLEDPDGDEELDDLDLDDEDEESGEDDEE